MASNGGSFGAYTATNLDREEYWPAGKLRVSITGAIPICGREKAPAASCRKALTATEYFEMWGDGKQTRSFTFIDECVEGVLRLTKSDFQEPVYIGSDEMGSENEIVLSFDNKKLPIKHIQGPEGVRGRNSDNTLIKKKLRWALSMRLKNGLATTCKWFKEQIENEKAYVGDVLEEVVRVALRCMERRKQDWPKMRVVASLLDQAWHFWARVRESGVAEETPILRR